MAGFLIAIISGALMSLQGAFNTNVTKASSVWVTAMFVQLTALATCAIMWVIDGRPDIMKLFKVDNKITLLGGVIGAFITFTVIKSISGLGIAKAEVTIVVAQIIVSYLLGLFGLEVRRLHFHGLSSCRFLLRLQEYVCFIFLVIHQRINIL